MASDDQPVFIESPGYVSLLIVPGNESPGRLKIALKPSGDTVADDRTVGDRHPKVLDMLLFKIGEVQSLLATGHAKAALAMAEELAAAHPKLAALQFLKASCFVASGDAVHAKATLENALLAFPNHKPGRELYEALYGTGSRAISSQQDRSNR